MRDHLSLLSLLNSLVCASPWDWGKRPMAVPEDNLLSSTLQTGYPVHSFWEPSCAGPTALSSPLLWLGNSCLLSICFPGYSWYIRTILVWQKSKQTRLDTHKRRIYWFSHVPRKSKRENFIFGVSSIQKTKKYHQCLLFYPFHVLIFSVLASIRRQ